MGGDMFPLLQQIPNRANDYALDIRGDRGAEQEENQASTSGGHVGIVRVEKKEADMMPLGKREREGYVAPYPNKEKKEVGEVLQMSKNVNALSCLEQLEELMQPKQELSLKEELIQDMLSLDLTQGERKEYLAMLDRFPNLFITSYQEIRGFFRDPVKIELIEGAKPVSKSFYHLIQDIRGFFRDRVKIELIEGAEPVRQKLRRMGKEQMNALKEEVDKLLKAGFIVPIDNAELVSPVVITPKKDGHWSICIDYKPLNAVTKKDPYPLPFIDQLLDAVAGFERDPVKIELIEGAKPVRQKLRRMGKEQINALKEEVDKILKAGFIVPIDNAEWVSPVVITPKKDGHWRVCIDYKPLNAVTKKDPYPLPFIDRLLDAVAGFERYIVCDGYLSSKPGNLDKKVENWKRANEAFHGGLLGSNKKRHYTQGASNMCNIEEDKVLEFETMAVDYICDLDAIVHGVLTSSTQKLRQRGRLALAEIMKAGIKVADSVLKWRFWIAMAQRFAVKASTGFSPYHLVYGKEALLPVEVEIPALKLFYYEEVTRKAQIKANDGVKDKGIETRNLLVDLGGAEHKYRVNGYRLKKYLARLMTMVTEEMLFIEEENAKIIENVNEVSQNELRHLFTLETTACHE
ncbi:hypothetical protein L7F22_032428 [Adiantum nelumboides]|nr:hypothetical protein [Adiantum nelumboides]